MGIVYKEGMRVNEKDKHYNWYCSCFVHNIIYNSKNKQAEKSNEHKQ